MIALVVVIPLISAILCSVLPKRFVWFWTFFTVLIVFVHSIYITFKVYNYGIISYYMGGWLAPYGIELRADLFSCIFLILISSITTITIPYAFFTIKKQIQKKKAPAFYACFLLCFASLLGLVLSHDIFNIYVFLELSSLTACSLIAMGNKEKDSVNSAFEYLIIGTSAATFYLLGIGLIYMMTGTLNMFDVYNKLTSLQGNKVVNLGIVFILIGLITKTATFPFHQWMVNSYNSSPCYVTIFFSATTTKIALYLIIRFIYSVIGSNPILNNINSVLQILSMCAIIFGAVFALREKDFAKMLAFSSVSQIGYIILGISLNSHTAFITATAHLLFHSIAKPGLFMISNLQHSRNFMLPMLVIFGGSIVGFPITAGFVSKWYLINITSLSHNFLPILAIAIGSTMSLFYIFRNVDLFLENQENNTLNRILLLPPIILASMVILLGIYSTPLFNFISIAIGQLSQQHSL